MTGTTSTVATTRLPHARSSAMSAHLVRAVRSGGYCRFACAILLAISAVQQVRGDEPPTLEPSANIATRIRWIQFHMVGGRVTATSPMVVQRMLVPPSANQRGGRREVLSIEINAGIAGMQYDLVAGGERLQIAVTAGNQLSIMHSRAGGGAGDFRIDYRQQPERPVELSIDTAGEKRTWKGDGFWQIYLAEPELVRKQLIPLLELLRPSWQLAHLGSELEDALVTRAADDRQASVPRWTELVEQLASPKFAARETAQRELLQAGQKVLPYLQGLDRNRLDPEQSYRVRWLVDALAVDYEDRADRLAAALANDAEVWLSIMARDDMIKRRVAAGRLQALLGQEIDFDPAADAAVRETQLQALRNRGSQSETSDGSR